MNTLLLLLYWVNLGITVVHLINRDYQMATFNLCVAILLRQKVDKDA